MMPQVTNTKAAKSNPRGKIAPNAVKTALPPKKPKNNGKKWPKHAITSQKLARLALDLGNNSDKLVGYFLVHQN